MFHMKMRCRGQCGSAAVPRASLPSGDAGEALYRFTTQEDPQGSQKKDERSSEA